MVRGERTESGCVECMAHILCGNSTTNFAHTNTQSHTESAKHTLQWRNTHDHSQIFGALDYLRVGSSLKLMVWERAVLSVRRVPGVQVPIEAETTLYPNVGKTRAVAIDKRIRIIKLRGMGKTKGRLASRRDLLPPLVRGSEKAIRLPTLQEIASFHTQASVLGVFDAESNDISNVLLGINLERFRAAIPSSSRPRAEHRRRGRRSSSVNLHGRVN